jgi:hypothetical protein
VGVVIFWCRGQAQTRTDKEVNKMNKAQQALMVAIIALGAIILGGAFGYEGGFGLVVGGVGFWVSPGMSIIGGFAGFGLFVGAWIVGEEIGLYLSK